MGLLQVSVDASPLEKWASELSARGIRSAIHRAVDRSATAVRKVALDVIAKDIGVPKARLRTAVTKLRRTTQTELSASFTANKSAINMLATGTTVSRMGGVSGSTYRLTGGTSWSLRLKDVFIVHANRRHVHCSPPLEAEATS
jgi:activator of HSP90 ATPase